MVDATVFWGSVYQFFAVSLGKNAKGKKTGNPWGSVYQFYARGSVYQFFGKGPHPDPSMHK